jgi:hypothetical protein
LSGPPHHPFIVIASSQGVAIQRLDLWIASLRSQ